MSMGDGSAELADVRTPDAPELAELAGDEFNYMTDRELLECAAREARQARLIAEQMGAAVLQLGEEAEKLLSGGGIMSLFTGGRKARKAGEPIEAEAEPG